MDLEIENIGAAAAEVSGAFSASEIYVAFVKDFATLIAPKNKDGASVATTLEELVAITGDHTFVADKGFTKLKCIAESVKLETAQLGNKPQPIQENKLTVQLLGSSPEILGAKRWMKGEDLIVLAKEFGSDQLRQIGSAKYPASILESSSIIDGPVEGENTSTIVFQDKQMHDAAIYSGEITLQTITP